jgi:hypothetical protein
LVSAGQLPVISLMTLIYGPGANFFGFRDTLPAPLSHFQLEFVLSGMPAAQ